MTAEAGDRGSDLVRMIDIHRGVGDANTIRGIGGVDQLHGGGDVALDGGTDGTGIGVINRRGHDAGDGVESGDNGCEAHFGGQLVYATQAVEGRGRCSERRKGSGRKEMRMKKKEVKIADSGPEALVFYIVDLKTSSR